MIPVTSPARIPAPTAAASAAQGETPRTSSTEQPADTTEIEDGVLYSYTDPYGLDNAQEILFYLPGAPVAELPEGFKSWVSSYGDLGETLPFCGLYNVNAAEGFSSYDLAEPAPDASSAG